MDPISVEDISSSEDTAWDVESIDTDSVKDLSDMEDNRVQYDERTGELVIRVDEIIPPSDIPDLLPVVTDEEIWAKERTVIVRTDPEEEKRIRQMCEPRSESSESSLSEQHVFRQVNFDPIESESDWSEHTDGNNNNSQKDPSTVVAKPVLEVSDVSSESLEVEEAIPTRSSRNSPCPIPDCEFSGRKLKFHVQQMHLPRLMWENPQPPLKPEKVAERDELKNQLLLLIAEFLTGQRDLEVLVQWSNKNIRRRIPRRSQILPAARDHMVSLCTTMGWKVPQRFALVPIISPCTLIHWRYQVLLYQSLKSDQVVAYLSFGWDFMTDIQNLTVSRFDYAKSHSLLARILAGDPVEEKMVLDDQARDIHEAGDQRVVIIKSSEDWDQEIQSKKRCTDAEEGTGLTVVDVYDSHFHLDRASVRISGSPTGVLMKDWLVQQMERPPLVPVNLVGGVAIYCDPATYPETIPFDARWKVAVGLHPKSVAKATTQELDKFFLWVSNPRVSAVGEVGLDTSLRSGLRTLEEQKAFLVRLLPLLKPTTPVILHIRGSSTDKYSEELYNQAFQLLKSYCQPSQEIILHCFSGNSTTVSLWTSHFPLTHFSFTYLISTFDQEQLKALRRIPEHRLLVETDAPYMPPKNIRVNSPIYVGEVVALVATMRYASLKRLASVTTENARQLFK